ncbi:hypothetical protein QE152_g39955 [Popillia japonica]|uniref:Uncharacterized protein n=1 Tax=Popillia japonica TaxID=7064 RepID=A0AAW1HSS4_POPJA
MQRMWRFSIPFFLLVTTIFAAPVNQLKDQGSLSCILNDSSEKSANIRCHIPFTRNDKLTSDLYLLALLLKANR